MNSSTQVRSARFHRTFSARTLTLTAGMAAMLILLALGGPATAAPPAADDQYVPRKPTDRGNERGGDASSPTAPAAPGGGAAAALPPAASDGNPSSGLTREGRRKPSDAAIGRVRELERGSAGGVPLLDYSLPTAATLGLLAILAATILALARRFRGSSLET